MSDVRRLADVHGHPSDQSTLAPRPKWQNNRRVEDQLRANPLRRGTLSALVAATLFGVTTPFIQMAGKTAGPVPTAALLYAGAALASVDPLGRRNREAPVSMSSFPRLLLVAAFGAVVAPVCLAWGLQHTGAVGASLLLNFEAAFTVLFGWWFFREHVGRRVGLALALMAVAGGCLVYRGSSNGFGWGAIAIVGATVAWALDNALTRPLADLDPTQVVRHKASFGALFSFALSSIVRQPFPPLRDGLVLLACGALGYGVSLRFYLQAQRVMGAGRTGSVFAMAPFIGAVAAWLLGDRSAGPLTAVAACLFLVALYLHWTERHEHVHTHEELEHEHAHRHDDEHHDHVHDPPVDGEHSHRHRHAETTHAHPHGPDAHHRHSH
jgi:drug/metabolite transporter (DMT)-like permease